MSLTMKYGMYKSVAPPYPIENVGFLLGKGLSSLSPLRRQKAGIGIDLQRHLHDLAFRDDGRRN
jgi:hypothetical protein